ncbi:hypothetical protein V6N12_065049 [Hibiscus sabdariffa]|uniref:RNase H type-1 domain-containing protein n=1 Tax=Hibiscus sabdariffa TaxID=183260 RepID=A0ABR2G8E3_9ROSI
MENVKIEKAVNCGLSLNCVFCFKPNGLAYVDDWKFGMWWWASVWTLVKMVNSLNAEHSSLPLVRAIARLREYEWITNILWIPRGSNQSTDTLAKTTDPNSHGVVYLQSPPQALLPLMHEDTSTLPNVIA